MALCAKEISVASSSHVSGEHKVACGGGERRVVMVEANELYKFPVAPSKYNNLWHCLHD